MDIVSFTEARNNLKSVLDKVVDGHVPTVIFRQKGRSVVIIAKDDYDRMDETTYLKSSPVNARMIEESIAQMEAGMGDEHDLLEP
jgi:antitoxin YefM